MIFVSVGTHEQSFKRLVEEVDRLKRDNFIKEEVFIQKGYTDYNPQYCDFSQLLGYQEMIEKVKTASIYITHGGPGSISIAWFFKKIPIVVPRNPLYNEHVDNHQIDFVRRLETSGKVIPIYDVKNLCNIILEYDVLIHKNKLNFDSFSSCDILAEKIDSYCKNVSRHRNL